MPILHLLQMRKARRVILAIADIDNLSLAYKLGIEGPGVLRALFTSKHYYDSFSVAPFAMVYETRRKSRFSLTQV